METINPIMYRKTKLNSTPNSGGVELGSFSAFILKASVVFISAPLVCKGSHESLISLLVRHHVCVCMHKNKIKVK